MRFPGKRLAWLLGIMSMADTRRALRSGSALKLSHPQAASRTSLSPPRPAARFNPALPAPGSPAWKPGLAGAMASSGAARSTRAAPPWQRRHGCHHRRAHGAHFTLHSKAPRFERASPAESQFTLAQHHGEKPAPRGHHHPGVHRIELSTNSGSALPERLRPLRWPTVKCVMPSCRPSTVPALSTISPGRAASGRIRLTIVV